MKREIFLKFYLAFLITALSTTSINAQMCATGCLDNKILDKYGGGQGNCLFRTNQNYNGHDIQYCCTIANSESVACENCMIGYKIQGNTCVDDPLYCKFSNCENCAADTCLKCNEEFWWNNIAKTCAPCRPKCAACVSENKCTKCKPKTLIL
jgi:hypothetical protein